CANGAAYRAAPEIFRRLGAEVTALADAPDGRNINDGVGSTHLDHLSTAVVAGGHDVGFAFDGDADRVLAVDRTGAVVDRDALIDDRAVAEAIDRESAALEGRGRVLVRPSGTEPVVRVMVEAPSEDEATAACDRLVAALQGVAA